MRIAFFSDTFFPSINGVVTSICNAAKGLASRGHEILIFTRYENEKPKIDLGKGISIEYYKSLKLVNYPDFDVAQIDVRIVNALRKFKPDILHSHMPTFLGWEAVLASILFRIPLVGTYHTLLPDFLEHSFLPKFVVRTQFAKYLSWNYTRRYYNFCNVVVSPSLAMKRTLRQHRIKPRIKVISNGVDIDKFKLSPKEKHDHGFVYVGRVSYEKRIDVVLDAFLLLVEDYPDAKLTIVGGGPDLEALRKKYSDKRIVFKGSIPHKQIEKAYLLGDVFVTASTIETEGLVVLEAMATGLPVIGVRALAVPDIVKDRQNGFIVPAGNVKRMASAMRTIFEDNSLRDQMGRKSLDLVQKYSVEKSIDYLESTYKSLVEPA